MDQTGWPPWGIGSGNRKHVVVLLAIVATLLLAGCAGLTDGGDGTQTAEPEGTAVDASEVQAQSVAATANVSTYRSSSVSNLTQTTNNAERQTTARIDRRIDRGAMQASLNETRESQGRTQTARTWLVNGTVYQHSPALQQQYGSEWIRQDIGESAEQVFQQFDVLSRSRALLGNASVSLDGTETLDGTEVYVLGADIDETAVERLAYGSTGGNASVEEAAGTVWVDVESDRIVRMNVSLVEAGTIRGTDVEVRSHVDRRFSYDESVDITVPEEADAAVRIGNASADS